MTNWKILKAYNKIRQLPSPITSRIDYSNYSNNSFITNDLGKTKIRLISLIDKESDYAYSLNKRLYESFIERDKDKRKMMATSTLYQHLNELERFGMIARTRAESFRGGPIRFYYRVTARGKRALKSRSRKIQTHT